MSSKGQRLTAQGRVAGGRMWVVCGPPLTRDLELDNPDLDCNDVPVEKKFLAKNLFNLSSNV